MLQLRLQPIRVFCLHHVCAEFDADSMNECDWMPIEEFKSKVMAMQRDGVEFISMTYAYQRIASDRLRRKKYSVLTFDDGYASLKEILPWLDEQHIPVTLFVNGKYLDGESFRDNTHEKYLRYEELFQLTSSLIEIGSHGWEHTDATQMINSEFADTMIRNVQLLSKHPRYIPFHAYTWGRHSVACDRHLVELNITPVLIDGEKNYNDIRVIHRELL